MTTSPLTLAEAALPRLDPRVRAGLLAVGGSLLIALSAQLQIPFWPVPFTMQTFAVLVLAIAYGARLGTVTVALYLAEGLVGLPVYAGWSAGWATFTGATGGYLLGFLVAAAVVGWLADHGWDRTRGRVLAALLLGTGIIFGLGVTWLARAFGWDTAVRIGLLEFALTEAAKIGLAASVVPLAWSRLDR